MAARSHSRGAPGCASVDPHRLDARGVTPRDLDARPRDAEMRGERRLDARVRGALDGAFAHVDDEHAVVRLLDKRAATAAGLHPDAHQAGSGLHPLNLPESAAGRTTAEPNRTPGARPPSRIGGGSE